MRSLNEANVEYLLIGGYAVGYHGYPRATADIDVWVRQSPANAARVTEAVRSFGFDVPELSPDSFLGDDRVARMGVPPYRIEILTSVSGLRFEDAWRSREVADWDGVAVPVIGLRALRANKRASGRLKDLADLDALPEADDDDA